jgi:hypothetical protein
LKKLFDAFKAFLAVLSCKKEEPKALSSKKDVGHLTVLHLLQKRGRLIDFLMEDLSAYSDEQVGAAVREIHAECGKFIKETFDIRPIYEMEEGSALSLPIDTDLSKLQLSGNVTKLPLRGTLRHKGWEVGKQDLPFHNAKGMGVLAPAEVEV